MGLDDRVFIPYLFCLVWGFFIFNPKLSSAQRVTYIVHMDNSFMPKPFITQQEWYFSVVNSLKPANQTLSDTPMVLYTYDTALHGFSALLSPDEFKALKNISGFISAYSDKIVTLDTTHSQEFLSLTPSIGLWPASSYGEDIIIGVIDSGVCPESESFKGDGMAAGVPRWWKGRCEGGENFNFSMGNSKLIGARYFNKGALTSHPSTDVHVPFMNSARDDLGHGTQTSTVAAGNFVSGASFFGYANGTAKGVAPRAKVAIYKVYWDVGGYASDVLAEKEIEDNPAEMRRLVLSKLGKVPDEVRAFIENTDLDGFISSPLRYRHPWELLWGNISKGNACVAGDALHPMTPDIGQGGCAALEDGVVLAWCLAEALLKEPSGEKLPEKEEYKRIEMGLKKYAKERRWRSIELISTAYMVGFIQQGDGKVMYFFRYMLAAYMAGLLLKRADFDCGKLSIS